MSAKPNLCPTRNIECNFWEQRKGGYCGFAVVEGRGRCRLVDEVVGFGVDYVSEFAGEEGEDCE